MNNIPMELIACSSHEQVLRLCLEKYPAEDVAKQWLNYAHETASF